MVTSPFKLPVGRASAPAMTLIICLYGNMGAEDSLSMTQRTPSSRPPRPPLTPKLRAQRRTSARRRRQILLGTLLVVIAVSGVLAWQRFNRPTGVSATGGLFQGTVRAHGDDAVLNGGVLANAVQVQAALEAYRREHGRIPPSAEAFNREVLPRLEGGQLPRSPWGGVQPGILGVTADLLQAVDAGGDERWVIGPGQDARTIAQPTDFGALVYEVSGDRYRIFGVGRGADGRAVVLVRLTSP